MKQLTSADMQSLKNALDGFDAEISAYSGRGMYGRQCLGISGNFGLFELGVAIGSYGNERLVEALIGYAPSTDSMGTGKVIYWPQVSIPKESEAA